MKATGPRAQLALAGGEPVRRQLLPYGRQSVDEEDIAAVVSVLRSDWLTTGPVVDEFEAALADAVGAGEAVAVNSGTAALHTALAACDIGPGDEVIVPAMTFAATANAALYLGARPRFADVDPGTLLLDPAAAAALINDHTRAVIAVDYAGQPCMYDELRALCDRHGLALIADACHAPGASYRDRPVGSIADLSCFSFHPVKHLTSGEGGAITTADSALARRMRRFRNHEIATDHHQRAKQDTWRYDVVGLGHNYRLSDLQCALVLSQLAKLAGRIARRSRIAAAYAAAWSENAAVRPLILRPEVHHAWHLYVVRLDAAHFSAGRDEIFRALRAEGIGVNVHYCPVHLHQYYREHLGTGPGLCPVAEAAYEEIISLPLFPDMKDADVADVVAAVQKIEEVYSP